MELCGTLHELKEQEVAPDEVLEPVALLPQQHQAGEHQAAKPYICGVRIPKLLTLGAIIIYTICVGPYYINFNAIRDIMIRDQTYAWLCPEYDMDNPPPITDANQPKAVCEEQELAISFLFTIGSSGHFICACAGGIALDLIGPKLTGLLGASLQLLGWLLVAASSYTFQGYIPGFLCIGAGADTAFFATLSVLSLFPGRENGILGILGSMRSLSLSITLIMKSVAYSCDDNGFRFAIVHVVIVLLVIGICIDILMCPWNSWKTTRKLPAARALRSGLSKLSAKKSESSSNKNIQDEKDVEANTIQDKSIQSIAQDSATNVQDQFTSAADEDIIDDDNKPTVSPFPHSDAGFVETFLSPKVLLMLGYFIVFLLCTIFYTPAADVLLPDVYHVHQYITIFSFLPAPILGALCDAFDVVYVLLFLNTNIVFMLVFTLIPGIPAATFCQLMSSICYSISLSFKMSQIYCYASSHLPAQHIGRLVGAVTMIGGIVSLINSPLQSFARRNEKFVLVILFLLVLCGFAYGCIGFLIAIVKKKNKEQLQEKNDLSMELTTEASVSPP